MPSTPASRRGRVPEAIARPSRYGSFETSTTALVLCSRPSAPVKRRSSASPLGPSTVGIVSAIVRSLASRYPSRWTDFGVDTERHVVHEHAAVDLGEIHQPLAPVRERVESSHDVVAVDAEIEREMVTRPRRHAHVREPPFGGDRGDDRLRAVAARHAYRVRAVGDRVAHERREVIAEMQLDRLDAASASLARDLEALRLPAARLRVVEQHRPLRRRRGGERSRGR